MRTAILVLWVIDSRKFLCLALWIVGYDELYRINDGTHTSCAGIKILTDSTLHKSHLVEGIECGVTYLINELQYSLWRISPATETADCRHTRVVPTRNNSFLSEHQ